MSFVSRQIALIRELQIELNGMGAVIKTLPHLARPSDRIAKEVLAFTCIMLFNANASVQVGTPSPASCSSTPTPVFRYKRLNGSVRVPTFVFRYEHPNASVSVQV